MNFTYRAPIPRRDISSTKPATSQPIGRVLDSDHVAAQPVHQRREAGNAGAPRCRGVRGAHAKDGQGPGRRKEVELASAKGMVVLHTPAGVLRWAAELTVVCRRAVVLGS